MLLDFWRKQENVEETPPKKVNVELAENESTVWILNNSDEFLSEKAFIFITGRYSTSLIHISVLSTIRETNQCKTLSPSALYCLICYIYKESIQTYRCYQLIASGVITIQLTFLSVCLCVP